MLTIQNMDKFVEQYVPKKCHKNKNPLAPQHPFRLLAIGPTGGGKTNIIVDLVINHLCFDKIYIYATDLEDEKYLATIALFESLNKQYKELNETDEDIIEYSDSLNGIEVKQFNPEKQNLVIFDDMVTESKKNQKIINDLFIAGRKTPNCSLIYQTQSIFDTPDLLRKQASMLVLLDVNDEGEINEIAKRYRTGITFQEFKELYYKCISQKYGFMVVDRKVPVGDPLKYRCGFDQLWIPKSQQ